MSYDIIRFLEAQNDKTQDGRTVWESVLEELELGEKSSHWIWYIFPQLENLGKSPHSIYYGIANQEEAKEYMRHPILRQRYITALMLVLGHLTMGMSLEQILGDLDAMKFRSSLTLFAPYL